MSPQTVLLRTTLTRTITIYRIMKAIIALDLLLREGKVAQTSLLVQLARLIFENNVLKSEFSREVETHM